MPKIKKEKVEKMIRDTRVVLVNYTIKAVIPTGPFANIQPEITVTATSLEDAEKYVIPHIDKLFVKYFNAYLNGVPAVKSTQKSPEPTQKQTHVSSGPTTNIGPTPVHMKTEAHIKAEQAVNGCTSMEAINLVTEKIFNSVKLTPDEKKILSELITEKKAEQAIKRIR